MIVRWETDHDYVLIHVHQDMFGDWIFSRAWGQIGTQFGGLKHQLADDHAQAMMWLDDEATIQASRASTRFWRPTIIAPKARMP